MRINPKLYAAPTDEQPLDTQEFDERKIEIYNMNNFPAVKEEFINKGRFAAWSSEDGKNYRVFIEEGYYNELQDLYTPAINKIWVDFWDTCESISRKSSYRVILPVTILAIAGCFGASFLPKEVSLYVMIAVVVVAFGVMLFTNRFSKKKIYDANVASVEKIKEALNGEDKFNELMDKQKNYMDSYYAALYPEDEEDKEESEQIEEPKSAELLEEANPSAEESTEVEVVEDTEKEEKHE